MDTITNMLNKIRNAQAVHHQTVSIPFSKLKEQIVQILEKQGWIEKTIKKGKKIKKIIEIKLKYDENKNPRITGFKRISKPGQRIYKGYRELRPRKGFKITIISTPKGLMTDLKARKEKLGGEVIAEIW